MGYAFNKTLSWAPNMTQVRHSFKRTVDPAVGPVTVNELRTALDLDDSADDAELQRLLNTAVADVEKDSLRALLTQTWVLKMDHFPLVIELRRCPVASVSSITYVTDSVTTTLSASLYQTDLNSEPARITPAYGEIWPTHDSDTLNAITVTFVAGYTNAAAVPRSAWNAVLVAATHLYRGCEYGSAYWSLIDRIRWGGLA